MDFPKIPGGIDALFRQVTPIFLLGVILLVLCEPILPGGDWLRSTFGETIVLRLCLAGLGMYVLLLWGESLRLNAILSGVLKAFREHSGGDDGGQPRGARNPRARLEAARLLIAALSTEDAEIRRTSHHNLQRLAGQDLGTAPGPWQQWLARQEQELARQEES